MIFRLDLEVAVYPDRVQVTDRKTGLFVDHRAERPFSSETLLIADPRHLEHTLSHAVRKLMKGGFLLYYPRAYVARVSLSPVEEAALRTALANIGFTSIEFEDEEAGEA